MLHPPQAEAVLARSAISARQLAASLCRGCAPYHGIWQYLRLLGFATSPLDHAAFYRDAFRPLIRRGLRRVLVAGCADDAMAETAVAAFAAEGAVPDLTVVDACRTPLELCRRYAARAGLALETECADLVADRAARRFDIICTHVIFGHVAPERRPPLLANWRELLAPGGQVVTMHRIRPGSETPSAAPAEVRAFGERVRRAAEALAAPLDLAPAELGAMAEAFYAHRRPHPVGSVEAITSLFVGAGLRIEACVLSAAPSGAAPSVERKRPGGLYALIAAARA